MLSICDLIKIGENEGLRGTILDTFIYFIIKMDFSDDKSIVKKWAFAFSFNKARMNLPRKGKGQQLLDTLSKRFRIPIY
jgi:hypothetical protein